MTKSRVLRKLRAGDFVTVAAVTRVAEPWLTEALGRMGYDAIWFDMEHRSYGFDAIDPLSAACRASGADLLVRVRKTGYDSPMRALEFGANGIMVPHCRSAAEARQWVEWVRFPPQGRRGLDGTGADADFGAANPKDYLRHANEEVFLVLQIEDKEAVDAIDDIAAVKGFDLFLIGTGDLSLSFGWPFEYGHPELQKAIDRVAEAAAKSGKWWGIPTSNPERAQSMLDRGARLITAGVDHTILMNVFRKCFDDFSNVKLSG